MIQFEKEWGQYIGASASVGVNSATAALHLALTAFHFPPGRKVLVPAMTFASTATAITLQSASPNLCGRRR